MANNNGNGLPLHQLTLADSHEDRLQKVEGSLQEVAVSMGKMQTTQEFMSEHMASSSKSILEKLECIDSKFGGVEARMSPLEQDAKERYARRKSIRGILKAIILAMGGAVAAAAGTWIWEVIIK